MKLRLLIPVLLGMAASLYAAPPTDFLDIPWGSPVAEVKRKMAQRAGLTLKEESATKIVFQGGTFADYPAERFELDLLGGRFSKGKVFVVIPAGNGKDGAPLRNHQFEDIFKSLSTKYGKGVRTGDANHTEGNWNWPVNDSLTGEKRLIRIRLCYSWEPYEFTLSYSNLPTPATAKPAGKQKDL